MKLVMAFNQYKAKLKYLIQFLKLPLFAVIIGFLGAVGGSQNSSLLFRRCGIPLITTVYAYYQFVHGGINWIVSFWALTIMSMWGILALGYGQPSTNPPDEGSALGRFFWHLTSANTFWSNVLTRGTVGVGLALSVIVMPIMRNCWLFYGLSAIGIIGSWAFIAWRGWGSLKLTVNNKLIEFCVSDCVCYTLLGLFLYVITTWK